MLPFLSSCVHLFFPTTCIICRRVLVCQEQQFCLNCELALPYHPQEWWHENNLAKTFYGRVPFDRCFALCRYNKGNSLDQVLYAMKYGGRRDLCRYLGGLVGRALGEEMAGMQMQIVPVPVHARRRRKRGYNQAEEIAHGLAAVTGWPVYSDCLKKVRNNPSQTQLNRTDRWQNVKSAYIPGIQRLDFSIPVVLVDDVVTTGATLEACYAGLNMPDQGKLYLIAVAFSQR